LGTLYVSTLPAGSLDDWPLRAQRRLPEVSVVVASNAPGARRVLQGLPLAVPVVEIAGADTLLGTLEAGDAMLLLDGEQAGPSAPALALIRAALDRGFRVVSLPGPALPVMALVVSGLPAGSFVYLGLLPEDPADRYELLASVAGEQRTLVLVASGIGPELWASLYAALGARPVTVSSGSDLERGTTWRGVLGGVEPSLPALSSPCILCIGGAPDRPACWAEDRLSAEVQACLARGLSARQTAKQLALPSGWPRRAIYRLAVGLPFRESRGEVLPAPSDSFQEGPNDD
jgi:16S rRNA (cytidine1402-2'-O)-methyltransferase